MKMEMTLSEKVTEFVRNRILSGEYHAGEKLPTERELASMFGVSRITTGRALDALTNEGLVHRIQGRGTFVSKPNEDTPIIKPHKVVRPPLPVLMPHTFPHQAQLLLWGIERGLESQYRRMLYIGTQGDVTREATAIDDLLMEGARDAIIYPVSSTASGMALRAASRAGMRVVLLDRQVRDAQADSVTPDNVGGAWAVTDHLLRLWHRRIFYLSLDQPPGYANIERYRGYRAAFLDHGLTHDPAWVIAWGEMESDVPANIRSSFSGMLEYELSRVVVEWKELGSKRPTAVVVDNDDRALYLMRVVREHGWSIPDDLAIVGFDDHPEAVHAEVPLTTVAQDFRAMGECAANLLTDDSQPQFPGIAKHIVLPMRLVIRQSCGATERTTVITPKEEAEN